MGDEISTDGAAHDAAPPKTILVVCRLNGADYTTPFTDGKGYEATHYRNRLYAVTDDRGHVRYIIPGELCPHLQKMDTGPLQTHRPRMVTSRSVGIFEVVE
jgi:hypothetical protein